ncbi:MAG: 16S rRNA (uracil(1498)-N(3))-methyltransferase [Thermodesulfovibrionales bacterium]|nr:16S rRNA (uracil(1498)-N(3))-methyltransferase [Thermodesulfovibrionales bacterium]
MTIYIENIDNTEIVLDKERAHYLLNVMRCNIGDKIEIIDGKGKRYLAVIKSKGNLVAVSLMDTISVDIHPYPTILCQSIIKGANMDLIIRQTTELGVKEIYPLITQRTIVRETSRLKRWKRIAEESSEQSGRSYIPIIHEPVKLNEIVRGIDTQKDICLVFQKNGSRLNPSVFKNPVSKRIFLFIGPEGDFTVEELRMMSDVGIKSISLGRFVLRADTAGIIAVALVHHYIDDYE